MEEYFDRMKRFFQLSFWVLLVFILCLFGIWLKTSGAGLVMSGWPRVFAIVALVLALIEVKVLTDQSEMARQHISWQLGNERIKRCRENIDQLEAWLKRKDEDLEKDALSLLKTSAEFPVDVLRAVSVTVDPKELREVLREGIREQGEMLGGMSFSLKLPLTLRVWTAMRRIQPPFVAGGMLKDKSGRVLQDFRR